MAEEGEVQSKLEYLELEQLELELEMLKGVTGKEEPAHGPISQSAWR